jgi:hypothetical protein
LILRKDDAIDPIIKRCNIDRNFLFKEVGSETVRKGESLIYQLTLVNTDAITKTLTVRDVVPAQFAFKAMLLGAQPTRNGNTLTWSDVAVPPRTGAGPGETVLRFSVDTISDARNKEKLVNTGEIVPANAAIDTSFASAEVEFRTPPVLYLPLLGRR